MKIGISCGDMITLTASGEDEEQAVQALTAYIDTLKEQCTTVIHCITTAEEIAVLAVRIALDAMCGVGMRQAYEKFSRIFENAGKNGGMTVGHLDDIGKSSGGGLL